MTPAPFRWGARIESFLGGPARARVVALFAAVLALNTADTGLIGAVAASIEADLSLDHTQLGWVAGASAGVGVVAAPIAGVLADRSVRVRVLQVTIGVWSASMVLGGLANDFFVLLISRLALGAGLAAMTPLVASLIGDLFPPRDRARAYGWVLTGEIVGAGAGLLIGVTIASVLTWRAGFFLLAAATLAMAFGLGRWLPEPARGGQSWLFAGAEEIPDREHSEETRREISHRDAPARQSASERGESEELARAAAADRGIEPVRERVLAVPPRTMSFLAAAHYILRIPTVRMLIVASAIGYFFFAGLRTFAVIFAARQYSLSEQAMIGFVLLVGGAAVAGTVLGGRLADRALRRGRLKARLAVPAVGYSAGALVLLPALLSQSVWIAQPLIMIAGGCIAAANPPLDAARLDIVPSLLWGRAESVRSVLRLAAEAVAPVIFGFTADALHGPTAGGATGLRNAFLVMLVPLVLNGLMLLMARRTYLVDVATAGASDKAQT